MISLAPTPSATDKTPRFSQLDYVQAQAMQLTPAERSQLLEYLILSMERDPDVESAWDQLADQREAELDAGLAREIPVEEAMIQLRARLKP